jgi:hypothetical protein
VPAINIREIWSGRVGQVNDEQIREYKRIFRILTDSVFDGPETIIATPGVPKKWSIYREPNGVFDLLARCRAVDAHHDQDDPYQWLVEASYTTRRLGNLARRRTELEKPRMASDKQDDSVNPLQRPTIIKYSWVNAQRNPDQDVFGGAIRNSAGQRIVGLTADDSYVQLQFLRNEMTPNFTLWGMYRRAVNLTPFFGMNPAEAKFMSITADEQFEAEMLYYAVTYTIGYKPISLDNPHGWQKRVLDQGTAQLDANGKLAPIYDSHNRVITGMSLLDGNGKRLPDTVPAPAAVYLDFYVYDALDFNVFNLP